MKTGEEEHGSIGVYLVVARYIVKDFKWRNDGVRGLEGCVFEMKEKKEKFESTIISFSFPAKTLCFQRIKDNVTKCFNILTLNWTENN